MSTTTTTTTSVVVSCNVTGSSGDTVSSAPPQQRHLRRQSMTHSGSSIPIHISAPARPVDLPGASSNAHIDSAFIDPQCVGHFLAQERSAASSAPLRAHHSKRQASTASLASMASSPSINTLTSPTASSSSSSSTSSSAAPSQPSAAVSSNRALCHVLADDFYPLLHKTSVEKIDKKSSVQQEAGSASSHASPLSSTFTSPSASHSTLSDHTLLLPHVTLPPTIIYHQGRLVNWYFTDSSHRVRRKHERNCTLHNILECMRTSVYKTPWQCKRSIDLVAVFYHSTPHQAPLYLTALELNDFLTHMVASCKLSGVLQKFVSPVSEYNEMLRVIWTPNSTIIDKKTSNYRLDATRVNLVDRVNTYEIQNGLGIEIQEEMIHQHSNLRKLLEYTCWEIAHHFQLVAGQTMVLRQSKKTSMHIPAAPNLYPIKMTLYFKLSFQQKINLLFCDEMEWSRIESIDKAPTLKTNVNWDMLQSKRNQAKKPKDVLSSDESGSESEVEMSPYYVPPSVLPSSYSSPPTHSHSHASSFTSQQFQQQHQQFLNSPQSPFHQHQSLLSTILHDKKHVKKWYTSYLKSSDSQCCVCKRPLPFNKLIVDNPDLQRCLFMHILYWRIGQQEKFTLSPLLWSVCRPLLRPHIIKNEMEFLHTLQNTHYTNELYHVMISTCQECKEHISNFIDSKYKQTLEHDEFRLGEDKDENKKSMILKALDKCRTLYLQDRTTSMNHTEMDDSNSEFPRLLSDIIQPSSSPAASSPSSSPHSPSSPISPFLPTSPFSPSGSSVPILTLPITPPASGPHGLQFDAAHDLSPATRLRYALQVEREKQASSSVDSSEATGERKDFESYYNQESFQERMKPETKEQREARKLMRDQKRAERKARQEKEDAIKIQERQQKELGLIPKHKLHSRPSSSTSLRVRSSKRSVVPDVDEDIEASHELILQRLDDHEKQVANGSGRDGVDLQQLQLHLQQLYSSHSPTRSKSLSSSPQPSSSPQTGPADFNTLSGELKLQKSFPQPSPMPYNHQVAFPAYVSHEKFAEIKHNRKLAREESKDEKYKHSQYYAWQQHQKLYSHNQARQSPTQFHTPSPALNPSRAHSASRSRPQSSSLHARSHSPTSSSPQRSSSFTSPIQQTSNQTPQRRVASAQQYRGRASPSSHSHSHLPTDDDYPSLERSASSSTLTASRPPTASPASHKSRPFSGNTLNFSRSTTSLSSSPTTYTSASKRHVTIPDAYNHMYAFKKKITPYDEPMKYFGALAEKSPSKRHGSPKRNINQEYMLDDPELSRSLAIFASPSSVGMHQ